MECSRCGFSNPVGFRFCGNCGDRMNRICPTCEYENPQPAKFCSRCGSVLGNPCPNCGCDNLQYDRFCSKCGLQLDKVCLECNTINPLYAKFCNLCGKSLPETNAAAPVARKSNTAQPSVAAAPMPAEAQAQPQEKVGLETPESDYAKQLQRFIPPALRDMYLDARGNIEGEKKIVNMIFSDVTGFTTLSEKHADEPEEIQRVINECLRRQAKQVYALEGYVDKFVGDELVALFGAPIWHEDDAQRAVTAALKMRHAVEEYSDELEKEKGVRLHVHIGINTGRVSVGGMGDDMFMNYTVMGDPVNLASRIEHIAKASQIIVGELTCKLTKSLFDYKGPRYERLKGKAEPQPVYELIGPKEHPESTRGIEGHTSRMIGRQDELESLMDYAERAFAGPVNMVSITGEVGLGKSRLKEELKARLGDDVVWIEGRCLELSQNAAYSVFLDAIKSQFGVRAMDTEERVRTKITEGVHQLFKMQDARHKTVGAVPPCLPASGAESEDMLPHLFRLMSLKLDEEMEEKVKYIDDPEHLQKEAFLAVKTLLLQMSKEKPFVLALEDLHWIDDLSLDLIMFLMESLPDFSGIILCIHRPDKQSACQQIDVMARERFARDFHEVALSRLSDDDMKILLEALLPLEESSQGTHALKELILRKAEGNPFYLEEVIRTLLEDGMIVQQAGGTEYVIVENIEDIDVPTGVESIVRARIDRLTELKDGSKQTLLRASVIGRVFERRILESISPEYVNLDKHLDRLLTMELITPSGRLWPEEEYSFRHILTHDIAYESVIGRERRKLHGQIGSRLEELYPEHLYPDKLEYIVSHYRLSGDYDKATTYLIKAGHKARQLYNNAAAVDYYTDALEKMEELAGLDDKCEMQAEVHEGLGDVYRVTSKFDEALQSYGKAIEFCSIPESRAVIHRKMGNIYEKKGDYDTSKEQYESGLSELEGHPDSIELPRLYNGIGFIHYRRGGYPEAIKMCERALEMLSHKDDYSTIAETYKNLAIAKYLMGNAEEAFADMELSLGVAEKANDRMLLAQLHHTKAALYQRMGDLDHTIQLFQRVLEMRVELGDIDGQATTKHSLAMAYRMKGQHDEAIAYLKDSLELAQRVRNVRLVADSYNSLGVVYWYMKEFDKAIEYYRRCLEIHNDINYVRGIAFCMGNIAEVYREKGDLEEAEKHYLETIEMAEQSNDREVQCYQYHGLGKIYLAKGNHKAALEQLKRALELAEELNNREAMGDICKELCQVYQRTDRQEQAQDYLDQANEHYAEIGAEARLKELQELKVKLSLS